MATVDEALGHTPLNADMRAGIEAISANQEITFTKYVRLVLPLDGYVFWVKAELLSASALANAAAFNAVVMNQPQTVEDTAPTLTVKGSFHYATDTRQLEDETVAINRVIFTAEEEVQDLNRVSPTTIYIGVFEGVRFAFTARGRFYRQAGIHHYVGDAIYPAMSSQIIDSIAGFDTRNVVVSNSLPIWLGLNGYVPTPPTYGFGNPTLVLFPSFLIPDNLPPIYGAVHIAPESTVAIAGAPTLSSNSSHSQLVRERVKITMYGTRNFDALDFVDCVNQYSLDTDNIGIMNQPVIRDEKRTQSELSVIAMKKSIEFEVNYYQLRARDIARQLILSAIPTFIIRGYKPPPVPPSYTPAFKFNDARNSQYLPMMAGI